MIDPALLAKFRRRAPLMQSQDHLDRAMALFPVDQQDEVATIIQPLLKKPITARKVEPVEFKPKDPENPTLHEATVKRLNNVMALEERVAELEAENARLKIEAIPQVESEKL